MGKRLARTIGEIQHDVAMIENFWLLSETDALFNLHKFCPSATTQLLRTGDGVGKLWNSNEPSRLVQ
jgi:hypothetical protein